MSAIRPVIMCGGSGTRLWPLSRETFPKQFVPLLDDAGRKSSLLEATLKRVAPIGRQITCLSNEAHRFLVQEAMAAAGVEGTQLLEPEGRNTAAAMAAAALWHRPEDLLLFLPADHYIPDGALFVETVREGVALANENWIVTFGVEPAFPATGYGYIQRGAPLPQGGFEVCRFAEKPNAETAAEFLATGEYYWNAGIFLVQAGTLIAALERHAKDILDSCREAVSNSAEDASFVRLESDAFLACRAQSIDYAVMEHHDRVAVVPLTCGWSDVGNWSALSELAEADDNGNRRVGQAHLFDTTGTYVNAPRRPVVVMGVQDLVIVDTADAVLISSVSAVEKVREAVAALKAIGAPQVSNHTRVARPWGWYESIEQGMGFQVKRLQVKPGAKLSLQMHHHRSEHWVVIRGSARVTNGDRVFDLEVNQSTYIPVGTKHRLENLGTEPLEIIEVQSGDYLSENDIVRFDDVYGRQGS